MLIRRFLSSPANSAVTPAIYISQSHNPYFNLAYEDWLFRKTNPDQRILYLYRNAPCVVIGRNQNPWKEIDLKRLNALGIPLVRRKSGGGTVYHDLGNTNYSVMVPRSEFERNTSASMVSRALNSLGVNSFVNERHDICIDDFKISGSAYKIINARAYHHGTMLISAALSDLRGVLSNRKSGIVTKGVESVPSPVKNIIEWNDDLTHERFVHAVSQEFNKLYGYQNEPNLVDQDQALAEHADVRKVYDELQTWNWQWGQTPEFEHTFAIKTASGSINIKVDSRHARITACSIDSQHDDLQNLAARFVGERYADFSKVQENNYGKVTTDVIMGMKKEICD